MSFFERAKAAANDLAAKADAEMKKAGISTPGASAGTGTYGTPGAPPAPGGSGADRRAARPRGAGLPRGDGPSGVHRRPRAGAGDPARARVVGAARPAHRGWRGTRPAATAATAGDHSAPASTAGDHVPAAAPAAGDHPAGLDATTATAELGLGEQRPQHVGDVAHAQASPSRTRGSAAVTAAYE